MWNRVDLKARAKIDIRKTYWYCVLVSLVLSICTNGAGASSGRSAAQEQMNNPGTNFVLSMAATITGIAVIALSILVLNVLIIGGRRYYLENQKRNAQLGTLLFGFKNGWFGNEVLTMFLKSLFTALWTLLLVIPGIVKSYSYSMMPYILAENPSLDQSRVFEISKQMTNGQKMDMFILDLSFIGWGILSVFTCGILAIFYVAPYMDATKAQLYTTLRQNALNSGIATAEELPGVY
ncbi:MAG: DUF975 family protein [Hespellia sp.]|nr:DUF975 family protein [Hespellia sp.]